MNRKRVKAATAAASAALGLVSFIAASSPANADPKQADALIGVGSDTTQEVMNALAGFNNGINYTPVQGASTLTQLVSWDAAISSSPTCITPKAGGASFLRPNGSSEGRKALSRAIDGGTYGNGTDCGGNKATSNLIDFARSSDGPSGAGSDLTYIPFGRDAVSFAYSANGVAPVTTLTSAQLQAIYTVGPQTINGVQIIGCLPQAGSGTRKFWVGKVAGGNDSTASAATAACGATPQEHDGNGFYAVATQASFAGKQLIIPHSASTWIAQSNGVSPDRGATARANGVDLGQIDALGDAYAGTAPNLTPATGFYGSTTYGRDVYNVVPTTKINSIAGNLALKALFKGSSSAVCQETATIEAYGLLGLGASCGSTSLTGPKL